MKKKTISKEEAAATLKSVDSTKRNRSQSAEILGEKQMGNTATQISGYQKTIFEAHTSNGTSYYS
jgi:hypothetical protein